MSELKPQTPQGGEQTGWATEFYEQQDRLGQVYSGPVAEYHHQKAAEVTARLGGPGKRVLELGAGGGQDAFALAQAGHDVTALELVPRAAAFAQTLAQDLTAGHLTVLSADFYTVALEGKFDAVCYWDGFGIGSDAEQRHLLRRIAVWLESDGVALVDVCTPWYWAAAAGAEHTDVGYARRYSFDADGCRMLDTWWDLQQPDARVTQFLRCYSPADLRLLLEGTGLGLREVHSGGMFDQVAREYRPDVPLEQAMWYLAVLEKSPNARF